MRDKKKIKHGPQKDIKLFNFGSTLSLLPTIFGSHFKSHLLYQAIILIKLLIQGEIHHMPYMALMVEIFND